ncbi:hypothetical protein FHW00_001208 [Ochrobactrum sp. P6BSIII]|nr:hypothetical protein [Ochrobactrum sp. P6BSIII]
MEHAPKRHMRGRKIFPKTSAIRNEKTKRPETFASGPDFFLRKTLPETAMLPAPQKIMLTSLKPAASTRCDFLSAQFHFPPRLRQKRGNAQEGVFQSGGQHLQVSHQTRPPVRVIASPSLHRRPQSTSCFQTRFRRNNERCVNFEGFYAEVNNLLILSELTG